MIEFYWVSDAFTGFRGLLPSFAGFYWVSRIFTGFRGLLQGFADFYRVSRAFTGFCGLLPGFAGFYWVLRTFTGFPPSVAIGQCLTKRFPPPGSGHRRRRVEQRQVLPAVVAVADAHPHAARRPLHRLGALIGPPGPPFLGFHLRIVFSFLVFFFFSFPHLLLCFVVGGFRC